MTSPRAADASAEQRPDRLLLSVEEVADALAVGRTAVYSLLRRRELRSVTIGRCRRIAMADLDAFVAALRDVGDDHPASAC